jgi:hypothetical protein
MLHMPALSSGDRLPDFLNQRLIDEIEFSITLRVQILDDNGLSVLDGKVTAAYPRALLA